MTTVFISSTSLDLREYRDAAIEECNRLGLVPIAMEFFEAMGRGATAGSQAKLDQADLYVGIVAHRYGYIEEGREAGVTELEFDHATARGLDRLCFLVDPSWPWPEGLIEGAHAGRLAAFKARIEKSVIRALFTTVQDFQGKLRLALTQWVRGAPDPARPQPALSLKRLAPTPQNRLRFGSRQTAFVGRESEMALLRQFVDDPAFFAWMVLSGPAGAGKSRMAQELCLALAPVWRAGFLMLEQRFDAWAAWQPEADTVIVVDYAAEHVEETRSMLLALVARAAQPRGHLRVRVLLLERDAAGEWMQRLIGSRSDGYALESARYARSPLVLGPLGEEALWASACSVLENAARRAPPRASLLHELREIDPLGRPLFALLAADALVAHRSVRAWDRERLMRDVLARERERWAQLGVTTHYENLLALATLAGDLTEAVLAHPPPGIAMPADESFDRALYGVMTQCDREGEALPGLKPDLLGEFFVLEHVRGRNERVTARQAADLLAGAWSVRGGSRRVDRFNIGVVAVSPTNLPLFLHRLAIEDFADHPAAPHFLARPQSSEADLTYWPTLAAQGVAHFAATDRLDRAQALYRELTELEGEPQAPFDTRGAITNAGFGLLRRMVQTSEHEADALRARLRERAFAELGSPSVREEYARGAAAIIFDLHASPTRALVAALLEDQRALVGAHPDEAALREAHAVSLAQRALPAHTLEERERGFEALLQFCEQFREDVALYVSLAWAAKLLAEEYARLPDRLADAERMNNVIRGLLRRRSERPVYKAPDLFQGEDLFDWKLVDEDVRRMRLLLAESDLACATSLMQAQRFTDANPYLDEIHGIWWRFHRQDAELANLWAGAVMRHADAVAAAGHYEQVPKAIAALQDLARRFVDERAFASYAPRLSLNAIKRAIAAQQLAEAARLHSALQALVTPTGEAAVIADFAEASIALGIVYQEKARWDELYCVMRGSEWALRSAALRERLLGKGGDTVWAETSRWLESVLAAGGEA